MNKYFVGLDLGQSRDFTALAVVEYAETRGDWDAVTFAHRVETVLRLRHVERVPLGTGYPEIVERVAEVMRSEALRGHSELIVDGTGVGRPVVDLLRNRGMKCWVRPVIVTGGLRETEEGGYYGVPKRDLVLGLQVAVQSGALKIAAGLQFGPALVKEMAEMKVRVTPSGNEQFGAWREGAHDDLVFAVALACWGAEKWRPRPMEGQGRLI
jgi:hypothetical protein